MLKYILSFSFLIVFMGIGQSQELSLHQGFWKMKYYEDSNEISRKEFDTKMMTLPSANEAWKKSKTNFIWASVSGVVGGFGLGYWITSERGDNRTPWIAMAIGGTVLSAVFTSISYKNRKDALLTYNSQFDSGGIRVTPASSGVGLAIHF